MILDELREQIDAHNRALILLLGKRTEIARKIARIKKREKLPIFDPGREESMKEEIKKEARLRKMSPIIVEEMFEILLSYTRFEMELEAWS